MRIFSSKNKSKLTEKPAACGVMYNYIKIDFINGKTMNDFYWEYGAKKKGLLAKRIEMVYLEPGEYDMVAHGVTYQTTPAPIHVLIEPGKNYLLGAGPSGIFFESYVI